MDGARPERYAAPRHRRVYPTATGKCYMRVSGPAVRVARNAVSDQVVAALRAGATCAELPDRMIREANADIAHLSSLAGHRDTD